MSLDFRFVLETILSNMIRIGIKLSSFIRIDSNTISNRIEVFVDKHFPEKAASHFNVLCDIDKRYRVDVLKKNVVNKD